MNLGAFSVSLNVQDPEASRRLTDNLGFSQFHGDANQGWLIIEQRPVP